MFCLFQDYDRNNVKHEYSADSDGSNDGWKEVEMGKFCFYYFMQLFFTFYSFILDKRFIDLKTIDSKPISCFYYFMYFF